MAIYRIAVPTTSGMTYVAWAPSGGAAAQERRRVAEEHGLKKGDATVETIDLRPGKAGLIAYLNAFHACVPSTYVPAGYVKSGAKAKKKKR